MGLNFQRALWDMNLEEGAPLLGTLKVRLRKALVMSISVHRGPVGGTGRGLLDGTLRDR